MSITSGFFNSLNGDRKYNAEQLSSIFDGVISDGVFATIGSAFAVTASSGMEVSVAPGRCWFNHTWLLNDAVLPIQIDNPEAALNRIDAIVLDINRSDEVRNNNIVVVKGSPSSNPVRPTLINTESRRQYPIAFISVASNNARTSAGRSVDSPDILQSEITYVVGNTANGGPPFVTGVIETLDASAMVAQWEAQVSSLIDNLERELANVYADDSHDLKPIRVQNIYVNPSQFTTFETADVDELALKSLGYNYRAEVSIPIDDGEGSVSYPIISSMVPYLTFSLESISESGVNIANQQATYNGGVRIYSDGVPKADILMLTGEFRKAVVN